MPTKLPPAKSVGEETLALQLRVEGIHFEREFKFHETRKWRADFMVFGKDYLVPVDPYCALVEIDGGNRLVRQNKYTGRFVSVGRHTKDEDYDKHNEMAILGWKVLRFSPAQVKSGKAIDTIKRALA